MNTIKSGIDLSHVDTATRPQDDLYRHLNGKWLATHEIPADRASDGVAWALHDEAERHHRGEDRTLDGDVGERHGFPLLDGDARAGPYCRERPERNASRGDT